MGERKIRLSILWHMHQPFYLNKVEGRFLLPWTRLHSFKDYLDMPLLAAEQEGICVNFNIVPSLIEQWGEWRAGSKDRVQELCARPVGDLSIPEREEYLALLFRAHPETMIAELPGYAALFLIWKQEGSSGFEAEDLTRLKYWFHLAWLDPLLREEEIPARYLADPSLMTEENWDDFDEYLNGFPTRILETYSRLHAEGKIELTVSPYAHPILPLLCDLNSAKEALPRIELPAEPFCHPEDARWQIREARQAAAEHLGCEPSGMWPSEGSLSSEVLELIQEEGFSWTVTDEQVLANSLTMPNLQLPERERAEHLYRPYHYSGVAGDIKLVFRDNILSDRIGFTYASWDPEDAVLDFMERLKRIWKAADNNEVMVTVALDGENCWEFYRHDGLPFLRLLYRSLAEAEWIDLDSISNHLERCESRNLKNLKAGSWIGGNFSIWIGQTEDNLAWQYLTRVRRDLIEFSDGVHPLTHAGISFDLRNAWHALFIAEGSDWNWWYGDDHNSADDAVFDTIFRSHLQSVYKALNKEIPDFLHKPIPISMAPKGELVPPGKSAIRLDGIESHYFEWQNAAYFYLGAQGTAMSPAQRLVDAVHLAFSDESFCLRIDFNKFRLEKSRPASLSIDFSGPCRKRFRLKLAGEEIVEAESLTDDIWQAKPTEAEFAWDRILEIAIPWAEFPVRSGQALHFTLTFIEEAGILEIVPAGFPLSFTMPDADYDLIMWKV
ncbi:MAG: hypothetical protein GY835_22005 [bacterium]|nr:hypothetical protein [bacterium]